MAELKLKLIFDYHTTPIKRKHTRLFTNRNETSKDKYELQLYICIDLSTPHQQIMQNNIANCILIEIKGWSRAPRKINSSSIFCHLVKRYCKLWVADKFSCMRQVIWRVFIMLFVHGIVILRLTMECFCCSQWPDPAYRVAPPQLPLDSVIEDDERLMFDMDQHLRHCHCDCGHDGYEGFQRHKVCTNPSFYVI